MIYRAATFLLILLVIAFADCKSIDSFKDFEKHYNRKYASDSERESRKKNFEKTLKTINDHNKHGKSSYTMGINYMADWTDEEFQRLKGGIPGEANFEAASPLINDLPDSVDWRTKNIISPVKDQGQCGSCYAFGSTECIESAWAQKNGKLVVLAPEQVVDCMPNPKECGGTGGCGGGVPQVVYDYIEKAGMTTEADYPYTAGKSGEKGKCKTTDIKPAVNITSYKVLPTNSYTDLINTIATVGPTTIIVAANDGWRNYKSGVYDGCDKSENALDHVVQLVGYGSDSKAGDYWIVRNSWGSADWGNAGYIWIPRDANATCLPAPGFPNCVPKVNPCGACGIQYQATYPIV